MGAQPVAAAQSAHISDQTLNVKDFVDHLAKQFFFLFFLYNLYICKRFM